MVRMTKKRLEELGNEYADLLKASAATKTRIEEIQEELRAAFPDLGPQLVGPLKVSMQRNVRRDDAAFMAAYPFDDFPDFYKPAIDTKTIQRELAPAVLERFQIEGPHKVVPTPIEKGA